MKGKGDSDCWEPTEIFVCVCVSQVSASPFRMQQEELREKVSSSDVRPQSLAGRAADDAGDRPHMTCDLTVAYTLCPRPASVYSPSRPQTPCRSNVTWKRVANSYLQRLATADLNV